MSEINSVAADLRFVKDAVARKELDATRTPMWIPALWGTVALAGCVINDFNPRYSWLYWGSVPTSAFVATWLIAGRAGLAMGEYDRETGIRVGLHWSSIFYGAIPVVCLAFAGKIDGQEAGQLLILISGIVYFLAGVHFDRRWMLSGIVMILGAALLTYVTRYGWTTLGVLLFIALTVGFSRPAPKATVSNA
ncbi:MAG: hypothetical protein M3478_06905 [Planctomycetota bacterium]|nr:hypothetical protein [Planctomycetota bacterium]